MAAIIVTAANALSAVEASHRRLKPHENLYRSAWEQEAIILEEIKSACLMAMSATMNAPMVALSIKEMHLIGPNLSEPAD